MADFLPPSEAFNKNPIPEITTNKKINPKVITLTASRRNPHFVAEHSDVPFVVLG
jgi:hypothetical protein